VDRPWLGRNAGEPVAAQCAHTVKFVKATNLGAADGLSVIEWPQVEAQLTDLLTHDDPHSPNRSTFWLTTLNVDGSPHVTSVGAVWQSSSCWFQTGKGTRKAMNVARDPRCTISVATKGFDVMIAGEARRVTDSKIIAKIAALWAKSGWPAQPDASGTGVTAPFNAPTLGPPPWFVFEVKPRIATAVGTAEDAPGSMRWRF
jgi:Pyridoxamine 5'-phosphate oxidase